MSKNKKKKGYTVKQIDNDTMVITTSESENKKNMFDLAMYNFNKTQHIYDKMLSNSNSSLGGGNIDEEKLSRLAKNPQNSLGSITQINEIVKYYANKDDLTGKVCETIENNVNTEYKVDIPEIFVAKNKAKKKEKVLALINEFNKSINLENLILQSASSTFLEGTYIIYLKNTKDGNFNIVNYPLGIVEISSYTVDGEPVVLFNINQLKQQLQSAQSVFKSMKTKNPFQKTIAEEIKANYPQEVYKAYKNNDKYAILDPERTGVIRINDRNGLYGLTPIFKSLPAQLMLETIDTVDRKNTIAKSKKIIVQILRKELLGKDGKNTKHFAELDYAQGVLLSALAQKVAVVTAPAYVEKIEIIEPKTEMTNPDTILYYRNKVLNSLGINFLSNEAKSSFNSVNVNVSELLKMINKISRQVEKVINKYYKVVCQLNHIDFQFTPTVHILETELIDTETKLKFVDMLYSKIGASYQTIYELLGLNFNTELARREDENKLNLDQVFAPHSNSYTSNSNELLNNDDTNKKQEENQNDDKDKQNQDEERYKKKV